ncbi:MAG TPA: class I SAM-dependent methyltransferase [Blastocatellia bacterium]|nr:class I SAM-dependent methyltransferase [Blastocatellia bacterium]
MATQIAKGETLPGNAKERAFANLARRLTSSAATPAFTVKLPSGYRTTFGTSLPEFGLEVVNGRGLSALLSLDELRICEAYMDGDIDIVGEMMRAISLRDHLNDQNFWVTLWRRLQPVLVGRLKAHEKWVQNHYDSNNIQLYFLDHSYNTYTPGVFEDETESLEAASDRKHRLAFEGVGLKPGDRILDVGFGWGSFLRYAARRGVHVTGLTLSRQQLEYVRRELVSKEKMPAQLLYQNFFKYEPGEKFDAIIMLGVAEELADYPTVMERLARWLKPGKRIYLDFMAATQDFVFPAFISKYIYQGGTSRVYMPKFIEAVTKSPFELLAVYNDRRNYYLTAKCWMERYEQNRDEIREKFGERTYRMFRLYLAGAAYTLNHPSHLATAYRVFLELPSRAS